jgi:hypothetical protein
MNSNMNDSIIIESDEFLQFVDREFRRASKSATVDELAEFAFGSLNEAIEMYKREFEDKNETI